MITRNTVSLVEVLQLKNPENLRSLGPLLFRVLPPQCQILKPLVPGHRGAGWGQGWALLPSGTLSISEGSWYLPGLYRFSWRDRSASRPRAGVRRAAGLVRPEGRGASRPRAGGPGCLRASLGRASPRDRREGQVPHPGRCSLGLHGVYPVSAAAPSGSKAPAEPPRCTLRPTEPGQGPRTLPGWAGRGLIRSPRTVPTPSGWRPVWSTRHLHGTARAWTSSC